MVETKETETLVYEFGRDVDAYLARLPEGTPMRTLRQIAEWNEAHAREALKFAQVYVDRTIAVDHQRDSAAYREMRALHRATAGRARGGRGRARGWGGGGPSSLPARQAAEELPARAIRASRCQLGTARPTGAPSGSR